MAIGVPLNESSVAVKEESTEGTYVAETAGTDFVEVLADGLEVTQEKETIERNNLSSTLEKVAPRTSTRAVSGTIPVEYKADGTAGDAPETDALYKSLMGGSRSAASATTTTGNSSTVLNFSSHSFSIGDIVLVQESGAFEVRPISSTTSGTITFPFALANGAPSDGVVVEAVQTYFMDGSNAPTLSITRYIGGELREKSIGCRVSSASLENFTTGQVPSVSMGFGGLDFDREDGAPLFTPTFDSAQPPVVLSACVFIDGVQRDMNSFSFSIENEIGRITSTCSDNGVISSRITSQMATGSMDPYIDDADADGLFTKFKNNEDISIFGFALIPDSASSINATTGLPDDFADVVAFWIPQAKITEFPVGDQEGIATNAITWQAFRSSGNDSIFLSFI